MTRRPPDHRFPAPDLSSVLVDTRGAVGVEFALVSTALFLTLFGAIEFSRMIWTESSLNFAVQEAARCASVTPTICGTSAKIASYASGLVSAAAVPSSAFTAATAACGHKVSASFPFTFIATGMFTAAPTLTASACFP
jgi:Flp pilus assembly protein TadG